MLVLSLAAGLFELEPAATSELALELDTELLSVPASGQPPLVHCCDSSSVAVVVVIAAAVAAAVALAVAVAVAVEPLMSCGVIGHGLS